MRTLFRRIWAYFASIGHDDVTVRHTSSREVAEDIGPIVRRYLAATAGRWDASFSSSLSQLGTIEASLREVRRQLVHSRRVPGQRQATADRTVTRIDSFLADPAGTLLNALARFASLPRVSALELLSTQATALLESGKSVLAVDVECERIQRLWDSLEQRFRRQLPETVEALALLSVVAELDDITSIASAARLRGLLEASLSTLASVRAAHTSQLCTLADRAARLGRSLQREEWALEQQLREFQSVVLQAASQAISASGEIVEKSANQQLVRMESGAASDLFSKGQGTPLAASNAIRRHIAKVERTLLGHAVELDRFRPRSQRRTPKRNR